MNGGGISLILFGTLAGQESSRIKTPSDFIERLPKLKNQSTFRFHKEMPINFWLRGSNLFYSFDAFVS